ncbi:GIY-YIG nuclease family protein [Marivirga salinae]|uniref:GIY-YIG nuclease family protein n=1 Tax=Marivirga salinarum TaxID=3059078 RepID=A0AA49GFV0_9BACT|nr:GIY-YIG nuclease family protein [Marivirga sp. BDSF4-3]WKK73519.2 GIY-YIG nuclease family protein [Marivirga sp. BDSF4-3]
MTAKGGYVYIQSNFSRSVLYVGSTSNLCNRSFQHKNGEGSEFTTTYKCTDLIYYEFHKTIDKAILRERRIKKWKREWKINLIKEMNPTFRDLYDEVADMK